MTGQYYSTVRIAEVCHEANRAYCAALGDISHVPWADAPDWQKDSAVAGVSFHMDNPEVGPAASHANWCRDKELDGWVWGPTKNANMRTHPCMLPYAQLPTEQKAKDFIFCSIVKTMGRKFTSTASLPSQR